MTTMRGGSQVYSVEVGEESNKLEVSQVGLTDKLASDHVSIVQAVVKGSTYLFSYGRNSDSLDLDKASNSSRFGTLTLL
jgi:hypothetical protein